MQCRDISSRVVGQRRRSGISGRAAQEETIAEGREMARRDIRLIIVDLQSTGVKFPMPQLSSGSQPADGKGGGDEGEWRGGGMC